MSKQAKMLHEDSLESMIRQHTAGRLGHATIVYGPEGIGKLEYVKAMAHHLLAIPAEDDVLAHPDVQYCTVLDDKKNLSIEQIRKLTADAQQTTHQGKVRVLVINHADRMTLSAANALLKTLEEPGHHNYFFLITSHHNRLPATIKSRCQLHKLHPPTLGESQEWLRQQIDEVSSETIDQLLFFAFCKPSAALTIHQKDLLSVYQDMWQATQLYFKVKEASPWPLITFNQPEALFACLQLYVLNRVGDGLSLANASQAAWQAITDSVSMMVNHSGMNTDLLSLQLLNKLSSLYHREVKHAVG